MKKKIVMMFLAVLFVLGLAPGESRALNFLNNWYLDLDGAGGSAPVQINEYLDTAGPGWIKNTLTSPTTANFQDWGAARSPGYDGMLAYGVARDITAKYSLTGSLTLPGAVIFSAICHLLKQIFIMPCLLSYFFR